MFVVFAGASSQSQALIELTSDDSVWPGDSQDERLRMAFVQFTAECKKHRVRDFAAGVLVFCKPQAFPICVHSRGGGQIAFRKPRTDFHSVSRRVSWGC